MSLVKLRDLHAHDRLAVVSMLRDPAVMRFLGPRRALTEDESDLWFKSALANPSRFVIADVNSDEFIGFCGIKEMNGVVDFGYFIRTEFWGKGIAAKACELVVEKLATEVDWETVQVFISENNVASKRVAEKLGWQVVHGATKDGDYGRYYRITM
ncbi:GNAT family N-acetyltransferase [Vreelandella venusta]|uniref:GNAT family N-acetyltransferase n=1 Tax=Vreelandella venusta TaxID=44935 RepID=A0AAP9ZFR2_9GAMM|nr:GNAT family N-acetyltransferase [Halomonas venusta]MDW0361454.1 GNAT family N-acetyltransferase [Halomonas venusta]QRL04859.1 GNAT family N-acetyltransferase [Halomonas venusta]